MAKRENRAEIEEEHIVCVCEYIVFSSHSPRRCRRKEILWDQLHAHFQTICSRIDESMSGDGGCGDGASVTQQNHHTHTHTTRRWRWQLYFAFWTEIEHCAVRSVYVVLFSVFCPRLCPFVSMCFAPYSTQYRIWLQSLFSLLLLLTIILIIVIIIIMNHIVCNYVTIVSFLFWFDSLSSTSSSSYVVWSC